MKSVPGRAHGDAFRIVQFGGLTECRHSVCEVGAVASFAHDGGDAARGDRGAVVASATDRQLEDRLIPAVGDEEVTDLVGRHGHRIPQLSQRGRATSLARPADAGPGDGIEVLGQHGLTERGAVSRRHDAHPAVRRVGDVEIALRVDGNPCRIVEFAAQGGQAVAVVAG